MSTEAPVRIDAHHHVWERAVEADRWTAAFPQIDRTFTLDDLAPQLAAAGVDGTVLVETVDEPRESLELLALAVSTPWVRGVVGWVDLTAPDVTDRIAQLVASPGGAGLVGLRHQVQTEADPGWLTRPDVLRGLAATAESGLVFELLVRHHQLPAAVEAVRRTPAGRFALSHLGKPPVAAGEWEPWATHMGELAASGAVVAKLSGLVTEASPSWTVADLEPYAAHALSVFGPDRVVAGSDWPVCLLRADYETVSSVNHRLVSALSPAEQDAVLGGTAMSWYGLS